MEPIPAPGAHQRRHLYNRVPGLHQNVMPVEVRAIKQTHASIDVMFNFIQFNSVCIESMHVHVWNVVRRSLTLLAFRLRWLSSVGVTMWLFWLSHALPRLCIT